MPGILQKYGHVWKAYILGNAIYGLGGVDGLKAFYNEENVKRFPGMSANLVQAAWQLEVTHLILHFLCHDPPRLTELSRRDCAKEALMHACNG